MVLTVRTTDTPWYKNKSRASHTPDLFLHEAELLGDVLLVLAVVVLGQSKQAVAQPEHVLEGGVARARQVLYAQQGGLALHLRGGRCLETVDTQVFKCAGMVLYCICLFRYFFLATSNLVNTIYLYSKPTSMNITQD